MKNPASQPPTFASWTLGPVLMLLGLGAVILALRMNHPGLGDNHDPGPSAFPLILGICLALGGLWELVSQLKRSWSQPSATKPTSPPPSHSEPAPSPTTIPLNVLILLIGLIIYIIALPWLGFTLSTIVFAGGMMLRLGAGWKWSVPMAVLLVTGIHFMFVRGFKVQLPAGVLHWPW